jgi:hypothetical protein
MSESKSNEVFNGASTTSAFAAEEQWEISNCYTIKKLLGKGAFGRVYEAQEKCVHSN